MQAEKDARSVWSEAARHWEKHRDIIRGMFAPVTRALIDDAQLVTGNSVLDVATGPGEPALTIAQVVGPNGSVVGIDPASEMIEAARRAAHLSLLNNIHFEMASADRLPFSTGSFDAVVSRFGASFFHLRQMEFAKC